MQKFEISNNRAVDYLEDFKHVLGKYVGPEDEDGNVFHSFCYKTDVPEFVDDEVFSLNVSFLILSVVNMLQQKARKESCKELRWRKPLTLTLENGVLSCDCRVSFPKGE